jgi:hypothetical protein
MGKIKIILFVCSISLLNNCCVSNSYIVETDSSNEYNKNEVLKEFNVILNDLTSEFSIIVEGGFSNTEEGVPIGYTVYSLNDPNNYSKTPYENDGITFLEGHFYHFSPVLMFISYSNIAYLENGKVKIFKAVNCLDRGDDINKVIEFANDKLKNNSNKAEIIERIKNYRQFGRYHIEDVHSMKIDCECSPCQ